MCMYAPLSVGCYSNTRWQLKQYGRVSNMLQVTTKHVQPLTSNVKQKQKCEQMSHNTDQVAFNSTALWPGAWCYGVVHHLAAAPQCQWHSQARKHATGTTATSRTEIKYEYTYSGCQSDINRLYMALNASGPSANVWC